MTVSFSQSYEAFVSPAFSPWVLDDPVVLCIKTDEKNCMVCLISITFRVKDPTAIQGPDCSINSNGNGSKSHNFQKTSTPMNDLWGKKSFYFNLSSIFEAFSLILTFVRILIFSSDSYVFRSDVVKRLFHPSSIAAVFIFIFCLVLMSTVH